MDFAWKLASTWWRLLPGNPILVRVVQGASRRARHQWLRFAYLAVLFFVVVFSLVPTMSGETASLSDLAKGASQTFKFASLTQLALMCFLAPAFTASAITQERDAQTFNILLSTPLSGAQIVLGSLMSRLYFVFMLLIAGLPIFLITMLYGGVTTSQIAKSFALSGATALVTGAIAIFIAMVATGTRRTIFSFYLLIAIYLLSLYFLGQWDQTWLSEAAPNVAGRRMSWATPLHPFLALEVALNRLDAPAINRLGRFPSYVAWCLAYPWAAYLVWTTLLSFILTLLSLLFVRRGIRTGEITFLHRLRDRFRIRLRGGERRRPRPVWSNPVAWREAKTKASGSFLLRWAVAGAGIVAYGFVFVEYLRGAMRPDEASQWLAWLTMIQFGLVLLIAANTAATAMTREKESKTLDILLTTPLTSKYILWGKLRGLVSFAFPLLAGPMSVLFAFGLTGVSRGESPPAVWIETGVTLGALLVIYTALACVLGLNVSLRARTNVSAVMYSVGLLVLICGVLTAGGVAFVEAARGEVGAFVSAFTPFTAVNYLVHPSALFDTVKEYADRSEPARWAAMIGAAVAIFVHAVVAWRSYVFLVRDFDMTMRKQSGL